MVSTSIITKTLICSRFYVTWTLTEYTVRKIRKVWIALAHAPEMPLLYKMVSFYLFFICRHNLIEVLSREKWLCSKIAV